MNELHPWKFGVAAALAVSIVYALCALAVATVPEAALAFFNQWFHGLDLTRLKPDASPSLTAGGFLYGLASVAGISFAIAATFAGFYNVLTRRNRRI